MRTKVPMFRTALLVLALLLAAECVWLLLPTFYAISIYQLPADQASARAASHDRSAALHAADVGALRGDLWAQAAFTYADLLWDGSGAANGARTSVEAARLSLDETLRAAPHNSAAWLLLAGLSAHYPEFKAAPVKALKMSYYTGPSDPGLMPLRLRIAMQLDILGDDEMQQFVTRDIGIFLARQDTAPVLSAYGAATPAGKQFIERVVGQISPSTLKTLRGSLDHLDLPD